MVLFIIGEKTKKKSSMQARDIIGFIRLPHFPPAQLEYCTMQLKGAWKTI